MLNSIKIKETLIKRFYKKSAFKARLTFSIGAVLLAIILISISTSPGPYIALQGFVFIAGCILLMVIGIIKMLKARTILNNIYNGNFYLVAVDCKKTYTRENYGTTFHKVDFSNHETIDISESTFNSINKGDKFYLLYLSDKKIGPQFCTYYPMNIFTLSDELKPKMFEQFSNDKDFADA